MKTRSTKAVTDSRQTQGERTRGEILRAAEARFAQLGYAATRLEDVGEDVGIGRSAVLYHFRDKGQLYGGVVDELFGGLLAEVRTALAGGGTLPERMQAAVAATVDYVGRRPATAHLALRAAATTDPASRAAIRAQAAPFLHLLTAIFDEGRRAGVLQPVGSDVFHFVSAIVGATVFYVAALPVFVADLPYNPLAPEQLGAFKRDVLGITHRLLGIGGAAPRKGKRSRAPRVTHRHR